MQKTMTSPPPPINGQYNLFMGILLSRVDRAQRGRIFHAVARSPFVQEVSSTFIYYTIIDWQDFFDIQYQYYKQQK